MTQKPLNIGYNLESESRKQASASRVQCTKLFLYNEISKLAITSSLETIFESPCRTLSLDIIAFSHGTRVMHIPLTCIQLPESLHKVQVGTGWEQEQLVRLSIAASRVPNTSNAYAHLNFSALPFSLTLIP
jgi:hypothetical protein